MSLMQMGISAGLLVIVIVLIRAVALNKLPKTAFLILWGVVLVRLLIPVSIPAQFSIYSAVTGFVGAVLSDSTTENTLPPDAGNAFEVSAPPVWTASQPEIPAGAYDAIPQRPAFSIAPFTAIWFAGTFVVFIFFAVIFIKNHRTLRCAIRIRNNAFLAQWLEEYRLLRPISILQSDKITTPLAVGLIKPRIILPKCMDLSNTQLLHHVLHHEYYHIKRFDALWKILLTIALCIYWLNPLVWVMYILANRDLELTCDEMVLRHFGEETKTTYAYSIISMAEQRSRYALLYNGFSKNAAEERIISIMKNKKSSLLSVFISAILICVLTFGTLAVLAANTERDVDFDSQYPTLYDAAQPAQAAETYVPSQSYEDETDNSYQLYDSYQQYDEDYITIEADIVSAAPQSPFRIATTLEEVRAIQALDDGSIFVTNVDLPYEEVNAILRGQMPGIIVRNQDPNQDLDDIVAILNDFLRHGQLFSYAIIEGLLAPFPTLSDEERIYAIERALIRIAIMQMIRDYFELGEDEGNWGFGEYGFDAPIRDITVTLSGRQRAYELQLNIGTGEIFNVNPIAYPRSY